MIQEAPRTCIYCKHSLQDPIPSEHIIPESAGGRIKSKGIVCGQCNHSLGSMVDQKLTDWDPIVWCRTMFMISGKKGAIPSFDVQDNTGRLLRIGPGLRPEYTEQVPIIKKTDESYLIKVSGRSQAEAEQKAREILDKKRERSKGVYSALTETWEFRKEKYAPASNLHSEVEYDPNGIGRAVAKMCLALGGLVAGNALVCGRCFDPIRAYILRGELITELAPVQFEYRNLIQLPTDSDSMTHRVALSFSNSARSAIGIVELFGKLRWAAVLSWNYEGPDYSCCLVEHPAKRNELSRIVDLPLSSIPVERVLRQSSDDLAAQDSEFAVGMQDLSIALATIAAHEDILRFFSEPTIEVGLDATLPTIGELVSQFALSANVLVTRFVGERMATTLARELLSAGYLKIGSRTLQAAIAVTSAEIRRACFSYSLAFMLRVVLAKKCENTH